MAILMLTSTGLDMYTFPSKDRRDAVYERRNERRGFFSRQSLHFCFIDNTIKVFFSFLYLKMACYQLFYYVSRQEKGINKRNENTIIII